MSEPKFQYDYERVAQLEERNARLVAALEKIANGEGYYGAQALEYKGIARNALKESET